MNVKVLVNPSHSPGFDADLDFSILRLGHCLLGYPEFVQTSKAAQHHRSHLFGVTSGRFRVCGFLPHVSVYHVLGFLCHICPFFSHVGAAAVLLPLRFSSGVMWAAVQSTWFTVPPNVLGFSSGVRNTSYLSRKSHRNARFCLQNKQKKNHFFCNILFYHAVLG